MDMAAYEFVWFQHTAARRRLKAAGAAAGQWISFNTQPPEGGWHVMPDPAVGMVTFQHTAARRRLLKNWESRKAR